MKDWFYKRPTPHLCKISKCAPMTIVFIVMVCTTLNLAAQNIKAPKITEPLYIGELIPIPIDLTETQPEFLSVRRDMQKKQIEIFEILEFKDKPWEYLLYVAPFDTGHIEIEPIQIYAMRGEKLDTLYVEPFSFYVKTSLTVADTMHKDIGTIVGINFWKDVSHTATLSIIAIILLLTGLALYFLPKLLKQKEIQHVFVDTRPAWLIAMELLETFKRKRLLEDGNYLDFYFELSLIFRIFIEKQHHTKAVEMTTGEIKQALAELPEKREIIKILSEMDKIKFAKFIPSVTEATDILYWIEKYILSHAMPQTQPPQDNPPENEVNDV